MRKKTLKKPLVVICCILIVVLAVLLMINQKTIQSNQLKTDITSPFEDVETDDETFDAIEYLYNQSILTGNADGSFKPETTLNRAEWATILTKLSGAKPLMANYNNCFPDVKEEWFAPAVCLAKDQGWMKGYSGGDLDGLFAPGQEIKDIEVLATLARLTKWNTQESDIWYEPALEFAKVKNIYDDEKPIKNISREKTADVIFRSLDVVAFDKETYSKEDNETIKSNDIYDLVKVELKEYDDAYQPNALKNMFKNEFKGEISKDEETCSESENGGINITNQLEAAFSALGLEVTAEENMDVYISNPPNFINPSTPTKKKTLKCGQNMDVLVRLSKDFEIIPNDDTVKQRYEDFNIKQQGAHYLLAFSIYSYCTTSGKCICFVATEVISVETGIILAHSVSERGNCDNLTDSFRENIKKVEDFIGETFIPEDPKWYTPKEDDNTPPADDDAPPVDDDTPPADDAPPVDDDTPPADDAPPTNDTPADDDDNDESEINQVIYKFTCQESKVYNADFDAYEYSISGGMTPVDSEGKETYAVPNSALPGGGALSIGGRLCTNSGDMIPKCKNPKTDAIENVNFTETYSLSEHTAQEIKDEVNSWFWKMGGYEEACTP